MARKQPENACFIVLLRKMLVYKQTGSLNSTLSYSDLSEIASKTNSSEDSLRKYHFNGRNSKFTFDDDTLTKLVSFLAEDFEYDTFTTFCIANATVDNEILAKYETKKNRKKFWKDFESSEIAEIEKWATERTLQLFMGIKDKPKKLTLTDELKQKLKNVWKLYKSEDISKGTVELLKMIDEYGPHLKFLDYLFKFYMRWSNYQAIKNTIEKYKSYEFYDEYKSLFKRKLFECELREAYNFIPDKNIFYNKLFAAKSILEEVPNPFNDSEYFYLSGRYFLEIWWCYESNDKSNLENALTHLTQPLVTQWWAECYKCIVLKLLGKPTFKTEAESYKKRVLSLQNNELNKMQASLKTHSATAFVLLNDLNGLKDFCKKVQRPKASSDFTGSLLHHIDLIFYDDPGLIKTYKTIIQDWQ